MLASGTAQGSGYANAAPPSSRGLDALTSSLSETEKFATDILARVKSFADETLGSVPEPGMNEAATLSKGPDSRMESLHRTANRLSNLLSAISSQVSRLQSL